jgi:hypothetical protein
LKSPRGARRRQASTLIHFTCTLGIARRAICRLSAVHIPPIWRFTKTQFCSPGILRMSKSKNPCCVPCLAWPVSVSASVLVSVSVSRYRLPACPLPAVSESVRPQARSRGLVMSVCLAVCSSTARPISIKKHLSPLERPAPSHTRTTLLQATAVCMYILLHAAPTHPRRVVVLQSASLTSACPSMCCNAPTICPARPSPLAISACFVAPPSVAAPGPGSHCSMHAAYSRSIERLGR